MMMALYTAYILFASVLLVQPMHTLSACEAEPRCCQAVCREDDKQQNSVLMYRMMTPAAIQKSASYIDKSNTLSLEQLTFNGDPKLPSSSKILQIPLISASVVRAEENVVVKIAIGLDKTIGGKTGVDSDVMIMVSDGLTGHGFMVIDIGNFQNFSPCFGLEGQSGATLLKERRSPSGPAPTDKSFYPGKVEITLNVDERWGYCYTAHDAGFTRQMYYTKKLDPSKGLSLELYKNEGDERLGLKFLELTVLKEK